MNYYYLASQMFRNIQKNQQSINKYIMKKWQQESQKILFANKK